MSGFPLIKINTLTTFIGMTFSSAFFSPIPEPVTRPTASTRVHVTPVFHIVMRELMSKTTSHSDSRTESEDVDECFMS